MQKTDHDLLVEIHGDVKHVRGAVEDHEKRIRNLERNLWLAMGGSLVLGFLFKLFWH